MRIYFNFEGERAPTKNAIFWSTFFKKFLKTPFLAHFFTFLPAEHKFRPKQGLFSALGELEKSTWST